MHLQFACLLFAVGGVCYLSWVCSFNDEVLLFVGSGGEIKRFRTYLVSNGNCLAPTAVALFRFCVGELVNAFCCVGCSAKRILFFVYYDRSRLVRLFPVGVYRFPWFVVGPFLVGVRRYVQVRTLWFYFDEDAGVCLVVLDGVAPLHFSIGP